MNGLRGYNGWRWIFIIEGAITVLICIVFLFTFPTLSVNSFLGRYYERIYLLHCVLAKTNKQTGASKADLGGT